MLDIYGLRVSGMGVGLDSQKSASKKSSKIFAKVLAIFRKLHYHY
jgi:hypothetical protein